MKKIQIIFSLLFGMGLLIPSLQAQTCRTNRTITKDYGANKVRVKTASNSITASNTISASAVVIYDAGYEITLIDGFTAEANSEFHTALDGCEPAAKTTSPNELNNSFTVSTRENTAGRIHNFPNPFSQSTIIEFDLKNEMNVHLAVYNITGQEIAVLIDNEWKTNGVHQVQFDAGELSNGTYFYTLRVGDKIHSDRMSLIR